MAQTVNRVELIGYLGAAPIVKQFDDGQFANFSIAATCGWKRDNGQLQEATDWRRVVTRGRLAEPCARVLRMGSRVRIEGCLHTRSWKDRESGQRHSAADVIFLDARRGHDDAYDTAATAEV